MLCSTPCEASNSSRGPCICQPRAFTPQEDSHLSSELVTKRPRNKLENLMSHRCCSIQHRAGLRVPDLLKRPATSSQITTFRAFRVLLHISPTCSAHQIL